MSGKIWGCIRPNLDLHCSPFRCWAIETSSTTLDEFAVHVGSQFSAALVSAGNLSCFANVRYAIVQQMQVQVARYASAAAAPYAMISLLSAFASRSIPFDTFGTQLPAPGILSARPAKRSCTVLGYLHTRAAATQTPLKMSW